MNLPLFSLRNKTLVWMVLVIFTAWGIWNSLNISRREDPEIKISSALVVTIWPGAGAHQVETLVTQKIEEYVEEMSSVVKIKSTSREAVSVIEVEVDYNTDTEMEWQKLRNKLDIAAAELPDGIIEPDVMDDFGDVTAMIYTLSSTEATPAELEAYAKSLKQHLSEIDAVGKIELIGVQDEAIYIEGALESFMLYDFSPLRVAEILDAQNLNTPAGYLRSANRNYRLAPTGAFEVLDHVENAVIDVSEETGAPLKVRDVFSVRRGYREPALDLMKTDGLPSVGLDIRMKSGHNIVAMGKTVRAVAEEFAENLPAHVKLTLVHDQPREVDTFIGSFMNNLLGGLVLVVVVLLLSMGLRAAGIVAVGLPLSILITFALMPLFDVSLETMTIGAFIIALGMLVDNAIIVVDNVYVHAAQGESRTEAAWKGVYELRVPLIIGTLGTVFAFLPLLILGKEVGAYIRSLPIILSVSLSASLLLAVTLTPILSEWLVRTPKKKEKKKGDAQREERPAAAKRSPWKRRYERFMFTGMKLRYVVIAVSVSALIGAILLLPKVGVSFFPEAFRDQFVIDVWLPEGASLKNTETVAKEVEKILAEDDSVLHHVSFLGKGGPRFFISIVPEFNTPNYAQFLVTTKSPEATDVLVPKFSRAFHRRISGARTTVKKLFMGIPVEAPVAFRITGPDLGTSRQISERIQAILRGASGTTSVRDNLGDPIPSYLIDIDAEAAAMYGITATETAVALLTAYDGLPVTSLRKEGKEIPIYLRMAEADRNFENTLHLLRVPSMATGGKVPLSAFTDVRLEWSPGVIKRFNGQRSITVLADLKSGVLADEVMKRVAPEVAALNLPPGYRIESAGEDSERSQAFGDLMVAFALIIAALLFLLVVQFKSLKKAMVILFSVPLAVIGAILGLFFTGNSFSFMAFLGLISLAGMVIKNSVVWLEFVDKAQEEGAPMKQAICDAGNARFRPIMLTAGTTIGGLLPLALFGGSLWEGMAWAMIAGLGFATVLTLIVIPIIYYTFMGGKKKEKNGIVVVAVVVAGVLTLPATAAAETHPLETYLSEAETNASAVRRSTLDMRQAEEKKKEALSTFAPTVELQASATALNKENTLDIDLDTATLPFDLNLPAMTLTEKYIYQLSGKVTVPLYAGGKRIAGYRAAEEAEAVQQHTHRAIVDGVKFEAVLLYISILESHYRMQLYEEALEVDKQVVEAEEAKLEQQMATPLDLSIATTRAADSERKLVLAKRDLTNKKRQFNELIGRPLEASVEIDDLHFSSAMTTETEAESRAVAQLHEVRAIEKGIAANAQELKMVRGDLLPTFAIIGEAGYKKGDLGYIDGDDYWMITAAVTWQPFTDAVVWRRMKQVKIARQQLQVELEDTKRKRELEIREARDQQKDARKILEVATQALKTAEVGHENARISFDEGVLPMFQFSDAARSLYEARENYLRAFYASILSEALVRFRLGESLLVEENLHAEPPFVYVTPAEEEN